MKFQARIPNFASSSVQTTSDQQHPVLDGSDVSMENLWQLPPNTVALVGRPAVRFALDLQTPRIPLAALEIPAQHWHFEEDFGGHLFVVVTSGDGARASVIEAGPVRPNGTGALVPFRYPEDEFVRRGIIDFEPVVIEAPNGIDRAFFADLVRAAQRSYDGNQLYLAVEIPFLRVGRDSNSYAIGILTSCGIDPRALPRLRDTMRWEWTGYPGVEDPVHLSNFGAYLGMPSRLDEDASDVAYHAGDGTVLYVVVGGPPGGTARLPDGSSAKLDRFGRIVFSPEDAKKHGLPSTHTEPPEQIRNRVRFPSKPAPAGAEITLVVDGKSVALAAGNDYTGTIVARNDAIGVAVMRTRDERDVVLPLAELGVELRDPKRVDRMLHVGNRLTVGLHRDRHPRLRAHGPAQWRDGLGARRLHAPRPVNIIVTGAIAFVVVAAVALAFERTRHR